MRSANLGQVAKDVELELRDLGHGLDDEVNGGEVLHLGRRRQKAADLVSLLLGKSLLCNILSEELLYTEVALAVVCLISNIVALTSKGDALVESLLGGINQRHRDAGLLGSNEGNAETLHRGALAIRVLGHGVC